MHIKRNFSARAHWRRHVLTSLRYAGAKKITNLVKAYFSYLRGTAEIRTMPSFLKFEISRKCTVQCKYCEMVAEKDEVFYPLEAYKRLVRQFADYVFEVSLYDIGEPLENTQLTEFIAFAHQLKIGTIISTSLSIEKPESFWEQLILSGIDRIIVAIDGVSETVYKQYRTHGNLELVMANLDRLLFYKSKHKKKVFIEWQMLDLPWNKEEQEAAKNLARQKGCDGFTLIREAVQPRLKNKELNITRKKNCLLPYIILIVNAYNQVRSCYKLYHEDMTVGDLNRESFESIWNGPAIKQIRDSRRILERSGCQTCRE